MNISTNQEHLLDLLHNNPEFIVIDTDKSLGPATMERREYIQAVLVEHLINSTYKKVSFDKATFTLKDFKWELYEITRYGHERELINSEKFYFGKEIEKRI